MITEHPRKNRLYLKIIWEALYVYESLWSDVNEVPENWDNITFAMAKISEQLEVPDDNALPSV